MRKHVTTILLVLTTAWILPGCGGPSDPWKDIPGGPSRVLVSFPPLYCFAKQVAGDHAAVLSLLTTQGPHDYEPTAGDALKARKADLFVHLGLGLDDKLLRVSNSSGNRKLVVLAAGGRIPGKLLLAAEEHAHGEGHDHHHHHGAHDPHVWLGVPQAIEMVKQISAALQEIDAEHASEFQRRADDYIRQLQELQKHARESFQGKKPRIISTHDALRYFAQSFGVEIVGHIMPRPGIEASANQLAKLVGVCKKEGVQVIATEPQYPPGHAETLKRELAKHGVQIEIVQIDPLETAAELDANLYLRVMRQNIDNLAKELK